MLVEPRVGKAPLFQRAEAEIVDQHVGLLDQAGENFLPRRHRHVERERTLVAIDAEKIGRLAADEGWPPGAGVVAGAGRLDLDDVGAHVAEHHGAQRASEDAREIDDAQAGERSARFRS